jgi:hypothetical protein
MSFHLSIMSVDVFFRIDLSSLHWLAYLCVLTRSPGRHYRFLLCIRTRQQREFRSSFSLIILEQLYQGASTGEDKSH